MAELQWKEVFKSVDHGHAAVVQMFRTALAKEHV